LAAIIDQAQNQAWKQDKTRFAERAQAAPAVARTPTRPILSLKK
jgi:hypothetical protein